ncbi:MAG: ABC transporter ATP-binding protein [Planctomycetota bacterium]|nr:ABC transporter ATP-binding protein [Planctomycetota bacterium]
MSGSQDDRRDIQALLSRIWAAVVRYRRMVAAMVIFAVLQTVFTKLPFVVIKPLMAEMGKELGEEPAAPAAGGGLDAQLEDAFNAWFAGFASDLCALFGLGFESQGMTVVVACGIVALICGVLGAVTIYLVQTISRFFAYRVIADLRGELARHFLHLPLRFFGKRRMGDMISKVTNDTQVMQRSFEMAADNVIVDPLMILGNAVAILWFVPEAIFVLLAMLPLMAVPMYRQGKKVQQRSSKSLQAMGETTESLSQILTGIRTVKAFQLEGAHLREFESTTSRFLDRTRRVLRAKARSIATSFIGYQAATAVVLVLLGYLVLVEGAIAFDDVAVIIAPLATTYQHVKRVTRAYNVLRESAGALSGIEDILRTDADPAMTGGDALAAVAGDVELRDVKFSYGDDPVLRGVSVRAEAGQTVALVGKTGCGKSTTLDLLMRFHDPDSGAVLIDGRDLRELSLADYRRHTAVVSQDPFLFNTTLRENIACGRPGASQADVEAAAAAARIHDFIAGLPDGYDTVAGERGTNLSGGQKQRITIARAILRNPAILFLDEATSALDTDSEVAVQRALKELMRGRTSFVIAHRLSTIVDADRIVVLDGGRVLESGTHKELYERGGVYRGMFDKQTRAGAR